MKQVLFALLLLSLVACGGTPTTPAPPSATFRPTATFTPSPTPTATVLPTQTPIPGYPQIHSIEPASGPIAGGTEISIRGAYFEGASIQLDGEPISPIEQSDTEIRLVMPERDNGIAVIKIENVLGTGYGEFLYLPPSLDEINLGEITTIAGIGQFLGEGRPATEAQVQISDFVLGSDGSIHMAEPGFARITRIRPDGIIEQFAGTGIEQISGENIPASEAGLNQARGITLDQEGNLIIAEAFSHRIRRVDSLTGIITTIAGTGKEGFSGDGGPATLANLSFPNHPTFDREGNLYFLEVGNWRIRRISPDGIITTVAGNGTQGYSGDGGPAIEAQFDTLFVDAGGLAVDLEGNLYLADTNNNAVRRIEISTGIITTVINGESVREVNGIAFDQYGDLFFSAESNEGPRIYQMRDDQIIQTYGRGEGFSEDGTPASTTPFCLSIDAIRIDQQGNVLFSDYCGRLRKINMASGLLETVAGVGPHIIGENDPALSASLHLNTADMAFAPNGDLLIADAETHRIWRIESNGNLTAYLGNGVAFAGEYLNVPAQKATISSPLAIEIAPDGTMYFLLGGQVVKIDEKNIMRLVAGGQDSSQVRTGDVDAFLGDGGPAEEAGLLQPWDIALDSEGNLFIADTNNNRIRRVDVESGIITTVAGSGPSNGYEGYENGSYCGDGGPAIEACLNTPYGVAVDRLGNIFIADSLNRRIRKVDKEGIITTFVDYRLIGGDIPTKMIFDAAGNLYATTNDRIFQISPTRKVTVLAGGLFGFSGDGGPALEAALDAESQAVGMAIDSQGNLFFVDAYNRRVRVIKAAVPAGPANW